MQSLGSEACKLEYKYAIELKKPILPVLVDSSTSLNLLPPDLAGIQHSTYVKDDKEAVIGLSKALSSLPEAPTTESILPIPPLIPVSPLGEMAQRIDSTSLLDLTSQSSLLIDLKQKLIDPETQSDALELLFRLRRRDDLYAKIAVEVENAIQPYNLPEEDNADPQASIEKHSTDKLVLTAICMLPLVLNYSIASYTFDLTYLYIPIAALLGFYFGHLGVITVAFGAASLLPPQFGLAEMVLQSDIGLYVLILLVAQAFAQPAEFLKNAESRHSSISYSVFLLLLTGVSLKGIAAGALSVPVDFSYLAWWYCFTCGLGKTPAWRLSIALCIVVGLGTWVGGKIPLPIGDNFITLGLFSQPYLVVKGLVFYVLARVCKHAYYHTEPTVNQKSRAGLYLLFPLLFIALLFRFAISYEILDMPDTADETNQAHIYWLFRWSPLMALTAAYVLSLVDGKYGLRVVIAAGSLSLLAYIVILLAIGFNIGLIDSSDSFRITLYSSLQNPSYTISLCLYTYIFCYLGYRNKFELDSRFRSSSGSNKVVEHNINMKAIASKVYIIATLWSIFCLVGLAVIDSKLN